jgi:hypothetical protein
MKKSLGIKLTKLMQNNRAGVSVLMSSLLLVAIVTTGMSVLVSMTSENTQNALIKEGEIYQEHYELIQEMQEFLSTIIDQETAEPDNGTADIAWFWPANESTDIELTPELKVYVDGPGGSIATVIIRRYGLDSAYASELTPAVVKTVEAGSLITHKYTAASNYDNTYYWKIEIFYPGDKIPADYYLEFTTVAS